MRLALERIEHFYPEILCSSSLRAVFIVPCDAMQQGPICRRAGLRERFAVE